jgi:DNA-binding beta-propeller fold protein YncE
MRSTRSVLALVVVAFCGCAQPVFAVAPVQGSPVPVGSGPETVEFSPAGHLLAVANLFGSSVSVFSVNPDASAVIAAPGSPFPTEPEPFSVAFSPGGALLAVADFANGGVRVFG